MLPHDKTDLEAKLTKTWWAAARHLIEAGGDETSVFRTMMEVGTTGFLGGTPKLADDKPAAAKRAEHAD